MSIGLHHTASLPCALPKGEESDFDAIDIDRPWTHMAMLATVTPLLNAKSRHALLRGSVDGRVLLDVRRHRKPKHLKAVRSMMRDTTCLPLSLPPPPPVQM